MIHINPNPQGHPMNTLFKFAIPAVLAALSLTACRVEAPAAPNNKAAAAALPVSAAVTIGKDMQPGMVLTAPGIMAELRERPSTMQIGGLVQNTGKTTADIKTECQALDAHGIVVGTSTDVAYRLEPGQAEEVLLYLSVTRLPMTWRCASRRD